MEEQFDVTELNKKKKKKKHGIPSRLKLHACGRLAGEDGTHVNGWRPIGVPCIEMQHYRSEDVLR